MDIYNYIAPQRGISRYRASVYMVVHPTGPHVVHQPSVTLAIASLVTCYSDLQTNAKNSTLPTHATLVYKG